jgi:hypothetical protein
MRTGGRKFNSGNKAPALVGEAGAFSFCKFEIRKAKFEKKLKRGLFAGAFFLFSCFDFRVSDFEF